MDVIPKRVEFLVGTKFCQYIIFDRFQKISFPEYVGKRGRNKLLAKKGEELSILEIWVGERIRIFGQNIDPCIAPKKDILKSGCSP